MKAVVKLIALTLVASVPLSAHAHKAWLLPSATVSTTDQWITVDAAVSNDLFYFNHVPMRLDALNVIAPDGTTVQPQNDHTGKYRSTFDVHLKQNGTYKLAVANSGLNAVYEENGQRKRWRGTAARFASEVPSTAKNLQVSEAQTRVETFVTAGKPSDAALKPTNTGLELVPVTHPNDLYEGEPAEFKFLLDGKPLAQLGVTIIAGGTRYRDQPNEIQLKTDAAGAISVTWPKPGMYWLEAEWQDQKTSIPQANERRASYIATFEVLPQ
jgi:uncharacterized GH25 family protein